MKLGDRIVDVVRKSMPQGMTRAGVTTALNSPSGSVRREVQMLIDSGSLVDNLPDPKINNGQRPQKRLTIPRGLDVITGGPTAADYTRPALNGVHKEATATFESRFWSNVDQEDADGCWMWTGPINSEQQGVFLVAGQPVRARRLSVELSLGHIVKRVTPCEHSTLCVNPAHLQKPDPQQELPMPEPEPTAPKKRGKAKAR